MSDKTTRRRVARAKRVLIAEGWTVIPPAVPPKPVRLLDQCQYPDLRGDPGDTCTHTTNRRRDTPHGWLWLCSEHFDAPALEIFDARATADV